MKIHIICASTRAGRVGFGVTQWVKSQVEQAGHEVSIIDLRDHRLPFIDDATQPSAMNRQYPHPEVQAWSDVIAATESLIFVTPEYNHGYPGELKNAIDWLFTEWAHKPTGIVSYSGGQFAGVRAAEQLKAILSQVGSRLTQRHVALPSIHSEDGSDVADAAVGQLTPMLEDLKKLL